MRIILMNGHEAMIVNDYKDTVTVEPSVPGVLMVGGKEYPVEDGAKAPVFKDTPNVKAYFKKDGYIMYTVLAPMVYRGVLMTRLDPFVYVAELRVLIDQLEKKLEDTRLELDNLRGSIKYDAAGFLLN